MDITKFVNKMNEIDGFNLGAVIKVLDDIVIAPNSQKEEVSIVATMLNRNKLNKDNRMSDKTYYTAVLATIANVIRSTSGNLEVDTILKRLGIYNKQIKNGKKVFKMNGWSYKAKTESGLLLITISKMETEDKTS